MMKLSKIFLFSCFSFIIGVAIASFAPLEYITNSLYWFIGIIFCIVYAILFWRKKQQLPVCLFLLFLFFGIFRYSIDFSVNNFNTIQYYNGQKITVIGTVCDESDLLNKNQKLKICVKAIKKINERTNNFTKLNSFFKISGKILVTTDLYPKYFYGDELEMVCELEAPKKFDEFAYDRYLARHNIYSVCYYPKINRIVAAKNQNFKIIFYKNIFQLKNKLRNLINSGLPEPEASLANALVLGYQKNIPQDLWNVFSKVGISHIIAISGTHITILSILVMGLLLNIGINRKIAFWITVLFLSIYIILVGMPASALRAGLMSFLGLWALNLGRLNKLMNALVFAAFVLLLINPKLLRDDIGFQLSFLAVLGMILFYPALDLWIQQKFQIFKNFNTMGGFQKAFQKIIKIAINIFSLTIAAQILILPVLVFNFNQISLVAPISNVLILWVSSIIIVAILIALIFSLILPNLIVFLFLPILFLLKYIIIIANFLVNLPLAYFEI